ncbi:universal stress protein [Neolewinella litorea]|nr:universal stress protein [Neolewinella litorea]
MPASILIPVDYTVASHNAYRFGLHLAEEMGLNVVLAHYYSGSIDPRIPLQFTGDGTIQGSHLEHLRQFAYSTCAYASPPLVELPCSVEVAYEADVSFSPSAAIIKRAHRSDIILVVMASRSSPPLLGKWLGSTSTTVSEACTRPVFLVPEAASFQPFREIVVANNYNTADPYPLWQLEGLADLFKAKVHFTHVDTAKGMGAPRFLPWKLMEELLDRTPAANYPFEAVTVRDKDIARGLIDYADQVAANLIVIVNQTRSRWQALLRATLTQDLALRSHLPVLVLHTATISLARQVVAQEFADGEAG